MFDITLDMPCKKILERVPLSGSMRTKKSGI